LIGKTKKFVDANLKKSEVERPSSPILKEIEVKEEVKDEPYFKEDRPATPKFIPLPKGKDEETQIIDGELFDFDLEVKPILEILIGRSVIQAKYELIEEYERNQYLEHKRKYDRKREFELNKLQRIEAKYLRYEEEKQKRFKQKEQRQINDVIMQQKLLSNIFSHAALKNLTKNSFRHLAERGYFIKHPTFNMNFYMQQDILPKTENMENLTSFIEYKLNDHIENEIENDILKKHEEVLKKKADEIEAIKAEKIKQKLEERENERQRKGTIRA